MESVRGTDSGRGGNFFYQIYFTGGIAYAQQEKYYRSRFYQALADVKLLETGTDYDKLPDMWTIWILPYDPFGLNYMLYSVKNRVEESDEIEYNDGVRKLFLYTKGEKGGTKALHDLLSYLQNSREENAVDEELLKLLCQEQWRRRNSERSCLRNMD